MESERQQDMHDSQQLSRMIRYSEAHGTASSPQQFSRQPFCFVDLMWYLIGPGFLMSAICVM